MQDVRKIEVGELTIEEAPFELEQAIADARLFSIHAHRKNLNFVEDVGRFYEATVLGDRLRLRQILSNALSNSIKFTSSGEFSLLPYFTAPTNRLTFRCHHTARSTRA